MHSCVLMRQQKLFLRMYLDVYCKLNFNRASFSSFLLYLFVYLKQFQVLKENSFRNQHKTDMLDFYFCLECVPNITFLCQVYNLCFNQESSISQVFVVFGSNVYKGFPIFSMNKETIQKEQRYNTIRIQKNIQFVMYIPIIIRPS